MNTCVDTLRMRDPRFTEKMGLIEIRAPTKKEVGSNDRSMVVASGVFDLLHMGHVKFLKEAKKAGGENSKLIVIVARELDSSSEIRKKIAELYTHPSHFTSSGHEAPAVTTRILSKVRDIWGN